MFAATFFYDFTFAYSYLASHRVEGLAARTGASVRWRHFALGAVFKLTGNRTPLEVPAKGAHLLVDLQRWAKRIGVVIRLPSAFPVPSMLALRTALAAEKEGTLVPVTVSPTATTAPPKGRRQFTVSGGAGAGWTWKLSTKASGGTIDAATGAYAAGPTGGGRDVVQASDLSGASGTATVDVTAGVSVSPDIASLAPGASVTFSASGGSGTGFTWALVTNASGATLDTATGAYTAGRTGGVTDAVKVTDSLGNTATRSVSVTAGVSVSPATGSLAPGASLAFCASGGSGTGFTWALVTNASGATLDAATGAYTAGRTGGVTDAVKVTDSLGNTATVHIAVTAGVSVSPATASLAPGASLAFSASGGSGTGWTWALLTNASGATIDAATGAYTAGRTGGITDVVQVTDSLGNTATASVAVDPAELGPAVGCACGASGSSVGDPWLTLSFGLGALVARRRQSATKRG